jgi:hypothetical protein
VPPSLFRVHPPGPGGCGCRRRRPQERGGCSAGGLRGRQRLLHGARLLPGLLAWRRALLLELLLLLLLLLLARRRTRGHAR